MVVNVYLDIIKNDNLIFVQYFLLSCFISQMKKSVFIKKDKCFNKNKKIHTLINQKYIIKLQH